MHLSNDNRVLIAIVVFISILVVLASSIAQKTNRQNHAKYKSRNYLQIRNSAISIAAIIETKSGLIDIDEFRNSNAMRVKDVIEKIGTMDLHFECYDSNGRPIMISISESMITTWGVGHDEINDNALGDDLSYSIELDLPQNSFHEK